MTSEKLEEIRKDLIMYYCSLNTQIDAGDMMRHIVDLFKEIERLNTMIAIKTELRKTNPYE